MYNNSLALFLRICSLQESQYV